MTYFITRISNPVRFAGEYGPGIEILYEVRHVLNYTPWKIIIRISQETRTSMGNIAMEHIAHIIEHEFNSRDGLIGDWLCASIAERITQYVN